MICDTERQCLTKAPNYPHLLVIRVEACQESHSINHVTMGAMFVPEQTWPLELNWAHGQEVSRRNQRALEMNFAGHPGRRER
jgi:hypothetical protein